MTKAVLERALDVEIADHLAGDRAQTPSGTYRWTDALNNFAIQFPD